MSDVIMRCIECPDGEVRLAPRPDCSWTLRDMRVVPFPPDHPVPSCAACGEYYLNEPEEKALDAAVFAHAERHGLGGPPLCRVYCGVYGPQNPGTFSIAVLAMHRNERHEHARTLQKKTSAPRAWEEALRRAVVQWAKPGAHVEIALRDERLVIGTNHDGYRVSRTVASVRAALRELPHTRVVWVPRKGGGANVLEQMVMDDAHELARRCFGQ